MKGLAAFVLGILLAGGSAAAPMLNDFTAFVVVGDSLSDPGNLFAATSGGPIVVPQIPLPPSEPIPRYHQGRFSNGPVWADIVGGKFQGKPVVNAAFGLSGALEDDSTQLDSLIPDLPRQIGIVSQHALSFGARPLGAVWTGANDIIGFVEDGGTTPEQAAAGVIAGLTGLASLGITDLVAFTAPNIGRIPRFEMFQPLLAAAASNATARFNDALLAGLATFDFPGVQVSALRVDLLFDALLDDPDRYDMTETEVPCIIPQTDLPGGLDPFYTPVDPSPPPAFVCPDPTGYVFFDANHPTAAIHAEIAAEFVELVAPSPTVVPLPASLPLAAAAFALLFAARVRRA